MSAPESSPRDARWRPLIALLAVGGASALLVWACPDEGWHLAGHTVRIETPSAWNGWWASEPQPTIIPRWKPEDVEALLERYEEQLSAIEAQDTVYPTPTVADSSLPATPPPLPDSSASTSVAEPLTDGAAPSPSAPPAVVSAAPQPKIVAEPDGRDWIPGSLRIGIPPEEEAAFHRLFSQLDRGEPVHVLHYGDSQIEGDRISGTMRQRWQERWGGHGPGIQPPVPLVQSFSLRQALSGPWKRHTRFGRRDSTDLDENYGLLTSYATADSASVPSCIDVGPERRSPPSFARWDRLDVWHDTVHTVCEVLVDGLPVDTLEPGTLPGVLTLPMSNMEPGGAPVRLCFSGRPPRLFALHPVGQGTQWHSVAMRGSSGTLFRKLARGPFSTQLKRVDPDLIVLQFGGNTVPYTRDSLAAARYGGWFRRQIELFQALTPEAAILVIGPSDMAEKTGTQWTPFPQLDAVRTAIRNASLDAGVAHWDLLDAMGGLGSMPAWVASEPPLAGPDHVHFTPRGARQVGEWLDRAFWAEFRRWEQGGQTPAMTGMKRRPSSSIPLQLPSSDDR